MQLLLLLHGGAVATRHGRCILPLTLQSTHKIAGLQPKQCDSLLQHIICHGVHAACHSHAQVQPLEVQHLHATDAILVPSPLEGKPRLELAR